jgi:DNA replication ATP-dependent helicase Dna2
MNVSFTRARSKLIIIGSRKTLQTAELLAQFFDLMDSRGWMLKLPFNANGFHACLMEPDASASPSCKRIADEMEGFPIRGKENACAGRPMKKIKTKTPVANGGILKGRPILKDLVSGDL